MMINRVKRQELLGVPAMLVGKGKSTPITALHYSGHELEVYVHQSLADRFFCPSCGEALLRDTGRTGANSVRVLECEDGTCGVEWQVGNLPQLPRHIKLAMT